MAHGNTHLSVSELDFGNIKENLKKYLKSQSKFQDYDFEGSNINILLDILAYNTHYQTFYLNMVANEMFLDTAQLRPSVVSRAKELGYTPVSARGATAKVSLTVTPTSTDVVGVTVPKNLEFTTSIDNETYTFVTPESYNISKRNVNNEFTTEIDIVEGIPLTHRFTVSNNDGRIYTLPNQNIDTRSISVEVQVSDTNTTKTKFTKATDLKTVGGDSNVFFLQEGDDGQYEIEFGDGVLGSALSDGNIVIVEYRVCNGPIGNGVESFTLSSDTVDGHSDVTFSLVESARGGVEQEDIESIRYNAPKHYERQDRLVTEEDFRAFIREQYPEFDSISVWGGEKNVPPRFGQVFISIKPSRSEVISGSTKNELAKNIKSKNVVTLDVEFVDAEFIYLEFDVTARFTAFNTSQTRGALAKKVQNTIVSYGTKNLGRFDQRFRYSKLLTKIDNSDPSIEGNLTKVRMQKRFTPTLNRPTKYRIDFKNAISGGDDKHSLHSNHPRMVYSNNSFKFNNIDVFLEDNALGNIQIYRMERDKKIIVNNNIGKVDYDNGVVTLDSIAINEVNGGTDEIEVVAIPKNNDIVPIRNTIILFDKSNIKVTMVEDDTN